MPSSYTVNLGLEKPATGEQAGVWGTTANNSYDFLDTAIDGNVSIALSASAYTLMTNQGTASNGRNKVIIFTGALTQDASITIAPNTAEKFYFIDNQTTGGFGLVVSQGTGSTYRIAPGMSAVVYSNGLGGAGGVYGALADFQCDSLLAATASIANLAVTGASTIAAAISFTGGVTISPSLVLNLGGDASYDMFYRAASGQVARLPIGPAGDVLVATAAGPAWQASPPPSINMSIVGSVPQQVFYANASSQLAQDANHVWVPGTGLGVGMSPLKALSVGRGLPASIQLESYTPGLRELLYTSAGVNRWSLRTSAETENPGTNVGSNMQLFSYNDAATASNFNQAWFRSGRSSFGQYTEPTAQVAIYNQQAGQDGLQVIGAAGQAGHLQTWLNNAGTTVASIDSAGVPFFLGASYISLNFQKCLDINGAVAGHPVGTIHIGPDVRSADLRGTIAFEPALGNGGLNATPSIVRLFQRNGIFAIQFFAGGATYYGKLQLQTSGSANFTFDTNPP